MKKQEIQSLLEKYFNGESTVAEENILHEYFSGEDIDPELLSYKEYFCFIENEKDQLSSFKDLSDEIWNNIENHEAKSKFNLPNLNKLNKIFLAVAAGVVITIISVTLIKFEFAKNKNSQIFSDTYSDPELAYLEAKKTLLFISEKLNKGTEPMQNLKTFNEGTKSLGLIDNLDKGLIELKPVKSIEKVDKYIKNK